MDTSKRLYVYLVATFSALGGLLFGYDTGVISGAILFIRQEFALSSFEVGVVVSCVLLGAILGALGAGVLSDKMGRRKLLLLTALLFTLASIGSAIATNSFWLSVSRIFIGAAIGAASMTTPLYIAEIAPAAIRGRLVSLNQFAITAGIVASYLVDYAFAASGSWRWMVGVAVVPSLLFGMGMLFLPESPRWLVKYGFVKKAAQVLLRTTSKQEVDKEITEIQQAVQIEKKSWKKVMTPWLKRTLLIGIGLAILQQLTGINTVIYYAPMIFEFAGFQSAPAAILATVGVGLVNMLSTLIALWLLDKAGRRPLLLIGIVGMVLSLGALGFTFLLPRSTHMAWFAVSSLMVYTASFAVSLGPIFWLIISEIYPLGIRGRAMSVATIVNWASNLVVALTFLSLIEGLGAAMTFWFYGIIGILAWLFSYFFVPETKNRSLEEIETHWKRLRRKA